MPGAPVPEVLERNLEQLFARAYEPVEPSAEFRARLRLALENRIARPRTARTGIAWRVAAGILVLLGGAFVGWKLYRGAEAPLGVEELLADGRSALREVPAGLWRPLTDPEIERGVELATATLEIATPSRASARPVRIAIEPQGDIEAGPASRFTVGSGEVVVTLADGALALDRRELAGNWRIATSEGSLRLSNGMLEIACLEVESVRQVRAKLYSGSAEVETAPPFPLPIGREVLLVGGKVVGQPDLEPPATSPERSTAGGSGAPDGAESSEPAPTVATLKGVLVGPGGVDLPDEFVVTLLRAERLPQVSMPLPRTFSDPAGAFSFEGLKPGEWTVFVQVQGYAAWVTRGLELAAGKTAELRCELDPGVALRGRVLDADGNPVEGALVLAEEDTAVQVLDLAIPEAPAGSTAAARSDAEGAFELRHLRPGPKTLRASRSGYGAGWSEPIDPDRIDPADPKGGVEIRLARRCAIEGRVMHDDGAPWPGAQVIAAFLDMSYQRPCMSFRHTVAGADGHYAAEDLPPGFYVIFNASEGRAPGGPVSPRIVQARVEPGQRTRIDLPGTLQGTVVEGRIVMPDGEPAKGFDVSLASSKGGMESWKAARSGEDGTFRFPDVAPGSYDVFVGEGLGKQFVRQEKIDVPAVPVFRPTITVASGSLRGQVKAAATGQGLPMSVVIVETETGGVVEFVGKTMSDAHGRYEFRLLAPGRYRATAYATSGRFGQESRSDVEVPGEALDFALHPGAELTIRVKDASGRAVPGAAIRFTSASGSSASFSPDDATDANGIYRVLGVKPGRWTIAASHEPEGRAIAAVELSAGEERTLDVQLASDH